MKPRPPERGQLEATGIDGQTEIFDYSCEEESHLVGQGYDAKAKWCFMIVNGNDVFQFDLVKEENFMRVEMMAHNGCARYKARGIPEAFIRLSHQIFDVPICSSKRPSTQSGSSGIGFVEEQHSEAATKVWRRLVASNEASFNERTQRFVYPASGDHG